MIMEVLNRAVGWKGEKQNHYMERCLLKNDWKHNKLSSSEHHDTDKSSSENKIATQHSVVCSFWGAFNMLLTLQFSLFFYLFAAFLYLLESNSESVPGNWVKE